MLLSRNPTVRALVEIVTGVHARFGERPSAGPIILPTSGAGASTRIAELHSLVAEAERRRANKRPLNPLLFALGGFLAGALSFAAGMWAASRCFL